MPQDIIICVYGAGIDPATSCVAVGPSPTAPLRSLKKKKKSFLLVKSHFLVQNPFLYLPRIWSRLFNIGPASLKIKQLQTSQFHKEAFYNMKMPPTALRLKYALIYMQAQAQRVMHLTPDCCVCKRRCICTVIWLNSQTKSERGKKIRMTQIAWRKF